MDNRQKVTTIAHSAHSSGELTKKKIIHTGKTMCDRKTTVNDTHKHTSTPYTHNLLLKLRVHGIVCQLYLILFHQSDEQFEAGLIFLLLTALYHEQLVL